MCIANQQLCTGFLKKLFAAERLPGEFQARILLIQLAFSPPRIFTSYKMMPICCIASGNYVTICNYLEMELRYMDAGE